MSHVFDSRSAKGAILPLQHHQYDDPPHSEDPWRLELRISVLGARIEDRIKGDGKIGHYVIPARNVGDITGALLWPEAENGKPGSRGQGAWSWVFPGEVVSDSEKEAAKEGFGRGGGVNVRVLRTPWEPDKRLAVLRTDHHPRMNKPPAGSVGMVMQFQEEREQFEAFISPHTQAALVAPWRGGDEEHGTIVYDLTDDGKSELDPIKNGRIQNLMRVTHSQGKWQPALNMSATGKKSPGGGGLLWGRGDGTTPAGRGVAHWLSAEFGGPIHAGHGSKDKHRAGTNAEDEPEQPGHIQIDALYYQDVVRDGPEEHGPDYPEVEPTDWQHTTHVYKGFDKRKGRWRWWTTVPLSRPVPPIPVPKVPDRPGDPVPVPQLPPPGGNPPGVPLNPTATNPGNPSLSEFEIGLPSLMFTGSRDRDSQRSNGRLGEGGGDTEYTIPLPDPTPPVTLPNGQITDGRIPIPPSVPEDGTGTTVPIADGVSGSVEVGGGGPDSASETPGQRLKRLRQEEFRKRAAAEGRRGLMSREAIDRGGPTPFTAHMFTMPSVTLNSLGLGRWAYKQRPGMGWGNGTSTAGALMIAQGGFLPDGPNDQSDKIGELDVLLYNGYRGGSAVRRFGWGQYSQSTDTWSDGVVFEPIGSAGSRNLRLTFKDNASTPADRQGTLQIRGSLTVLGAGDVGALSGPFANGYFTKTTVTTRAFTPQASTPGTNTLWVKTGSPTELWFTDSAGTETQIV